MTTETRNRDELPRSGLYIPRHKRGQQPEPTLKVETPKQPSFDGRVVRGRGNCKYVSNNDRRSPQTSSKLDRRDSNNSDGHNMTSIPSTLSDRWSHRQDDDTPSRSLSSRDAPMKQNNRDHYLPHDNNNNDGNNNKHTSRSDGPPTERPYSRGNGSSRQRQHRHGTRSSQRWEASREDDLTAKFAETRIENEIEENNIHDIANGVGNHVGNGKMSRSSSSCTSSSSSSLSPLSSSPPDNKRSNRKSMSRNGRNGSLDGPTRDQTDQQEKGTEIANCQKLASSVDEQNVSVKSGNDVISTPPTALVDEDESLGGPNIIEATTPSSTQSKEKDIGYQSGASSSSVSDVTRATPELRRGNSRSASVAADQIVEIYDFPSSMRSYHIEDLLAPCCEPDQYELKWVDETHCLVIFRTAGIARKVLETVSHSFFHLRPFVESSHQVKNAVELSSIQTSRPQTTAVVARRLISGHLKQKLTTEQREEERKFREEARKTKLQKQQQRQNKDNSAWSDSD
eukprot:GILK01005844.1.p1 GENE.GILK01005844.1~~GILK01005844.1.p1  ORF type:complete len:511 (-),score=88.95 GILK01005844.1:175-1707(-)